MTDQEIIEQILAREGGYVNRADDRGGPTNRGITLATFASWRCRPVSLDELKALTVAEAREIYRHRYIGAPGLGRVLDDQLRALLVDCAVLHGPKNAVRFLQRAVGAQDDGVFGEQTSRAMQRMIPHAMTIGVFAQRLEFLGRLISHDLSDADRDGIPDATENASGWLNRFAGILREVA